MRLLVLHSRLSDRGGADRWLLGVMPWLASRADTLLCVGQRDPRLADSDLAGVGAWRRVKGLERRGARVAGAQGALGRLDALLEEHRPDRILVNDVVDPTLLERIADTGRALMMVQDHRSFCPGPGRVLPDGSPCTQAVGPACDGCFVDPAHADAMRALTLRRLAAVRRMSGVLALSRYMAGELVAAGVGPERVSVVPPFVHGWRPSARLGDGGHHLLVGRLTAQKGVDVAAAAVARGVGGMPLVLVGEGSRAEAAVGPRVSCVGWADRPGLMRWLDQARCLWMPSVWAEPFGIVGLEAMSRAVPVIASDVGGVRDWLVPGETGLLVPPGDATALADAAQRMAGNAELARTMGLAGLARLRAHFTAEGAAQRLWEVLQGAVG